MKRTLISETKTQIGEKVFLKTWLHTSRILGKLAFLIVRDRSGVIQIVIEEKEEIDKVKNLQAGSVLYITGIASEGESKEMPVEIKAEEIKVEVEVTGRLPVDITKEEMNADLDTTLDYRPLILRHPKQQAIFRVQAGVLAAFGNSMRNQGFTEFRNPVLIGSPSESGATVFKVNYFDGDAFMAQSPQIYKQIMVGVFERAFTISPVFRAEKHNTSRHIMELTQMDGEMGFIETYDEVLEVVEQVVRDMLLYLEQNNQNDLSLWKAEMPKLPQGKFPKLKVKEALKIIEERTGKSSQREELDLDPEDEREISKWALEEHNSDFLWLLNFKANKNFYTWDNPEDAEESLSFDLECRGLEWLSGTHRIHKYELLLERLRKQGLKEEHYEHYLQAFKYGMPSEGGFSLGLERITKQILQLENVREATLFPSDLKRIAGAKRQHAVISGGKAISEAIRKKLDSLSIEYNFLEHEPTPTSEDAARVRGISMNEGAKALILKMKKSGKNVMAVIPGDKKSDMKKIAEIVGEAVEFENPEVIKEKYGIEIGGVPPFGGLLGLRVLVDEGVGKNEKVAFNCGERTCSIIMKSEDFLEAVDGEVGSFCKND